MNTDKQRQLDGDLTAQQNATDDVLLIDDVARRLLMTVRTIERRIRAHAFPIPELPRLDHRRRWSRAAVDRWIATATQNTPQIQIVRKKGK